VLSASPTGGVFSGNGINGNSFDPNQAGEGTHTISYTFSDTDNCEVIKNVSIIVENCLSLNEQEVIAFKAYPNPSADVLNIVLEGKFSYTLFDLTGKFLLKGKATGFEKISTEAYKTGVYFLTVKTEHSQATQTIIKQ